MRHLATIAVMLAALAWAGSARAHQESQIVERVVVVVNDDPIYLSEIRRRSVPFVARIMQAPQEERPEMAREIFRQVTDHLIDEALIAQAAQRAQVHVARDDVDRALRSVMNANHLDEAQFWQAVRGSGFTEAGYREDVKRQIKVASECWHFIPTPRSRIIFSLPKMR